MKPRQGAKDEIAGNARTLKGKVKQAAGKLTGNRNLESEGKGDELAGRVQRKGGQIERVFEK